jgi:hypothetical protein
MTTVSGYSEKDARRFVHKVDIREEDACWRWRGAVRPYGAPVFWYAGQARSAQDFAYVLAYKSLPEGYAVRPQCESPDCVNPRHLLAEWSPRRWSWPQEFHDAG